jgi:L-ascorbate metabolism protein UlaG (beta-lactamase superfamily)
MGKKIAFLGDTGYAPFFAELGARFGPFDLVLIPIGAYRPRALMQGVHLDPEEAVQVHLDMKARRSIAMHWGTFLLADDPLHEAPQLLEQAKKNAGVGGDLFRVQRTGETVVL